VAIVDGLITLADARASLGWAVSDNANDADLERYVEAATPVIENITGPLVLRTGVVFTLDGGRTRLVLPTRFASVTSIVESGVPVTDFVAEPSAGLITGGTTESPRYFAYGVQNIVVTVVTGAATIPANVQLATRELVRFLWQQGRQANIPAFGEAPSDASVPMGFAVPKRVMELLQPTPRIAGFA
jgi:hypothetical protein